MMKKLTMVVVGCMAMVADAYFGTISDWCRAHGFKSGEHLMGEESFNFHVSHYGDSFRCMRRLDAPSNDCLTSISSQVPWLAALFAGSARELNGAQLPGDRRGRA